MDDYELPRVPLTAGSLARVAAGFGPGRLHGDDAEGKWDVEFPSVASAAAFAGIVSEDEWGWHTVLRDPVTDLRQSCVLTVSDPNN
jgi:hypothetical protein